MSSNQNPYYYYPSTSRGYDESGAEPPVSQPSSSPEQAWPPTATTSHQNLYSQTDQPFDPVGNQLDVRDAGVCSRHNSGDTEIYPPSLPDQQDMNYSQIHPGPHNPLPSSSSQDHGAGTYATHTNVNIPYHYYYPQLYNQYPQQQYGLTPYEQIYDYSQPAVVHHPHQMNSGFAIHASQGPSAPAYPYPSSAQVPSLESGEAVYQMDIGPARPAVGSSTLHGAMVPTASRESPIADAGQHSHPVTVAVASSNQTSVPGPSRSHPSSPERKRLLPLSAEDSTTRRVVRRYDAPESSASSSRRRSRSNSAIPGRGPLIPQERYTTSSIPIAEHHPSIPFNLEDPSQTGIPISDILHKTETFARIQDGTQAFSHMGKKTFTLRLQWPGYEPWSKTIAALDWTKSRAPITRVKLAEAVATAVRDLFGKYRDKSYDQDSAEWNVGPNGIQLDQVCLVSLHQVSRGSWQPRLCLLTPRR